MSPIEKIKEAFLQQDWTIIQEAFKELTGQDLESKPVAKRTKAALDNDDIPILKEPKKAGRPKKVQVESKQSKDEDFTMVRKPRQGQQVREDGKVNCAIEQIDIRKVKNDFVDDKTLARKDAKIDKKLMPKTRKERDRPEYSLVETECVSCGRIAKVEPFERKHYRCNRCMPKPG